MIGGATIAAAKVGAEDKLLGAKLFSHKRELGVAAHMAVEPQAVDCSVERPGLLDPIRGGWTTLCQFTDLGPVHGERTSTVGDTDVEIRVASRHTAEDQHGNSKHLFERELGNEFQAEPGHAVIAQRAIEPGRCGMQEPRNIKLDTRFEERIEFGVVEVYAEVGTGVRTE